ncbi:MAG: small ribosomal subunit biogenesis GTPase RsgA [Porticoccaceae bacterium]|nr:small ribosomal subunit biogenesis GTPase RsgA [Porticoccaceae bacterium]
MAKRRLSLQQQRRIASQQQRSNRQSLPDSGDEENFGSPQEGLVTTRFSHQALVMPTLAEPSDKPYRCHFRANITDLVTGDRVIWRQGKPTGIIESVLPRRSLMSRPDARGQLRPVAANVDQIGIVFAPEPQPHQNLIDRYLVAAEHLAIKPLLIFNKMDSLNPADIDIPALFALYKSLGYELVQTSAKQGLGLTELHGALRGHTTVLVGQSGVGKSSIINRILPLAAAAIGDLSQIAKGRHTTTAAKYYVLPEGGSLIDSPGIREFGLWHLEADAIARGFIDFEPYLGACRFRNCRHFAEPDCAIVQAVAEGDVRVERLLSYQQIVNDLANAAG